MPQVATVEEAFRTWDVRLTVLADSWQQLTQVLPRVRADPAIRRTHLSVATRLNTMGHQWRLDILAPEQQQRLAALHTDVKRPVGAIPPHFTQMMTVLERDGRATSRQIAAATGIHPTTAARYLRHALESGLVSIRCELAQEYSGYPVACQWYARVPPDQLAAAERFLRSQRTLRLCAATTGNANLTFFLWLRTPADIPDIEAGLQSAAPDARIVESEVGVYTHKRMGWLLNPDSTATGDVVVRAT